jgi:hypothetical protein
MMGADSASLIKEEKIKNIEIEIRSMATLRFGKALRTD